MIYSPSRGGTQTFQRCARLYDLSKRWEAPSEWRPELVMGNAIHAGLAAHYTNLANLGHEEAQAVLAAEWQSDTPGDMTQEAAWVIVRKCIAEALKIDLLGTTGHVVAVEQAMGPEKCHPDLVIAHDPTTADNRLQVIDWKFSLNLKPEWVAKRLASYETLWQLWHYAWRVEQEFKAPCKQITVVQMAGLPRAFARRVDYEVTPELLKAWETGARQWWVLMKSGFNAPNYEGCRKYGEQYLCTFYDVCHRLAADESKFDTLYRRKA